MAKLREAKTVLIIEDEDDIRKFASRLLEMEGYHVLQTADGGDSLSLMRENGIDCVLLTLKLPQRDGWEVLEQVMSQPDLSAIPVIVFTALAEASHRERALSMGAAEYLIKPLGAADLKEAVVRVLNQKR
jgi:DNA-binding response OmpR family regulator